MQATPVRELPTPHRSRRCLHLLHRSESHPFASPASHCDFSFTEKRLRAFHSKTPLPSGKVYLNGLSAVNRSVYNPSQKYTNNANTTLLPVIQTRHTNQSGLGGNRKAPYFPLFASSPRLSRICFRIFASWKSCFSSSVSGTSGGTAVGLSFSSSATNTTYARLISSRLPSSRSTMLSTRTSSEVCPVQVTMASCTTVSFR